MILAASACFSTIRPLPPRGKLRQSLVRTPQRDLRACPCLRLSASACLSPVHRRSPCNARRQLSRTAACPALCPYFSAYGGELALPLNIGADSAAAKPKTLQSAPTLQLCSPVKRLFCAAPPQRRCPDQQASVSTCSRGDGSRPFHGYIVCYVYCTSGPATVSHPQCHFTSALAADPFQSRCASRAYSTSMCSISCASAAAGCMARSCAACARPAVSSSSRAAVAWPATGSVATTTTSMGPRCVPLSHSTSTCSEQAHALRHVLGVAVMSSVLPRSHNGPPYAAPVASCLWWQGRCA